MNMQGLRVQSLKARMALSTLAIFLLGMWALSYYASTMLRRDMVRISGQQQLTTVTSLAGHLNEALKDRFQALEGAAQAVTPALMQDAPALHRLLAQDRLLAYLFNAGVFLFRADGTAIADAPRIGRAGVNYMERDFVAAALQQGKSSVGRPVIGKKLGAPNFSMAIPIHDRQGQVIGALAGVSDLSRPNFLDKLIQNPYGLTGGYVLVARESQLIVSATDKSRIMDPAGKTAMAIRHRDGYEGSDVYVNGRGVEVLASVKGVPLANWYLASSLPTTEAFAPIYALQERLFWATLLLSLLACSMTWWLLRRQLFPILTTVEQLAVMAKDNAQLVPLPVPKHTEVAALVTGVNRVLETLESREAALLESEAFRRAIIDSIAAEIVVLDPQGVITAVNQQWLLFARETALVPGSVPPDTGIGVNYLRVCRAAAGSVDEGCALQVAQGLQAVLDGRLPSFTLEYPCHAPDEQRWFMVVVTPLNLPGGGAVVAHHSITARKVAEDRTARSEERLARMLAGANDAFWDLDLVNHQMFYSSRWWSMLGYCGEPQSSDPELWLRLLHPDDAQRVHQAFANSLSAMLQVGGAEFRLLHQDGHYVSVECRGVITRDENGNATRISGANTDLTERKLAEANLLSAKAEAETANLAKSRFLAAASHDLRQPLAALALYTGMLGAAVRPGQEPLLPSIQHCVDNLSELLNDLLDVSKLDAGGVVPMPSDFSVDDLCASLRSIHAVSAEKKGLQLRYRYAPRTMLRTDRQILSRIVGNLIDNAVRYTAHGGVLLATRRHAGKLWLEVWDTGVGIAQAQIAGVFEEFRQLGDGARNRGSGLGLAIVSKSAALLGLEIRVQSRPGRGSLFAIELPQGAAPEPGQSQSLPPQKTSARLLTIGLVEDNAFVLNALVLGLQNLGHSVFAGGTGAALLEQLGPNAPDVVVSDYRLGAGETGLDVITLVRARFGSHLAALILTGETDSDRMRHLASSGIAVCFKPVSLTRLQSAIQQVASGIAAPA